jgi:ribosomal protein S18 acetylase RimI-like enzyme
VTDYTFREAGADDWPFIFRGSAEAVWAGLSEERRTQVGREKLLEHYRNEARSFKGETRYPNLALVALDPGGELGGFVWVAETQVDGLGVTHGFVMDIYVEPRHRGSGLGNELMRRAEDWRRSRNLAYMLLAVSPGNLEACGLYGKLGYAVEKHILRKDL